ncbi:O-methyltransferase [uncultured Porphyromonas sp.]|uniref:O-methyltransferase n=1 Tax=uncultured Porphyromonas sp. TaxID=159274 RepID=UPI002591B018|nr:O-methyltransferase [uncultured Porphyromonas sp.]
MPIASVSEHLRELAITEYAERHTDREPEILTRLTREADERLMYPRMNCGHLQGRLLRMLVRITGAREVLELGTYAAYSTHCLAEGLPEGGHLTTIDVNDEMEPVIHDSLSEAGIHEKVTSLIGNATELLPTLDLSSYDLIYLDADKKGYPDYYHLIVPAMKPGTLLIADNTLWGGKVAQRDSHDPQTMALRSFNDLVAEDPSVEKVLIPLRDGLTLIYKKDKT